MINEKRYARRTGARIFLAVLALLALSVVAASGASAEEVHGEQFTTSVPRNWFTGPEPGTKLVGTESVSVSNRGNIYFRTSIGGAPIEFSASGAECGNCVIENRVEAGGSTRAVFSGQITLTGMKAIETGGCTISPTVKMKSLTGVIGGKTFSNSLVTTRLAPSEGGTWFTYNLTGCPIENTYKITGNYYGEFVNALGVLSKNQFVKFNQGIEESLQFKWEGLKFGGNPVFITGELSINSEKEFMAKAQ